MKRQRIDYAITERAEAHSYCRFGRGETDPGRRIVLQLHREITNTALVTPFRHQIEDALAAGTTPGNEIRERIFPSAIRGGMGLLLRTKRAKAGAAVSSKGMRRLQLCGTTDIGRPGWRCFG